MEKLEGEGLWFWECWWGCTAHPCELLSPGVISASHWDMRLRSNFRWPLPTPVGAAGPCKSNKQPLHWHLHPKAAAVPGEVLWGVPWASFATSPWLALPVTTAPCSNLHINLHSKPSCRRCMQMHWVIQIGFLFVNVVFCDCSGALGTYGPWYLTFFRIPSKGGCLQRGPVVLLVLCGSSFTSLRERVSFGMGDKQQNAECLWVKHHSPTLFPEAQLQQSLLFRRFVWKLHFLPPCFKLWSLQSLVLCGLVVQRGGPGCCSQLQDGAKSPGKGAGEQEGHRRPFCCPFPHQSPHFPDLHVLLAARGETSQPLLVQWHLRATWNSCCSHLGVLPVSLRWGIPGVPARLMLSTVVFSHQP